ncbi:MAG: hypothetical protein EHM85_06860 [Desulfobacteraceae bacterium]|nr:MAG: hypothetical protein EHM85_06860 [Desulfobacteraceae bacterium]
MRFTGKSRDFFKGADNSRDFIFPKWRRGSDIEAWIKANIDFSQYKNSMQAMGTVMKHFGKLADGNLVKKILGEIGKK